MYTPSRHFLDFQLAGFTYWDGLEVFDQLKHGTKVRLVAEPDNPYDNEAVAVYFEDKKLGYVPKNRNAEISKFLFFGYEDIFEAMINRVSPDHHPEAQMGVLVKLRDNRDEHETIDKD